MSLHQFPSAESPACTVWQVRLLLGRADMSDGLFVGYVQALVDECGFPRPFPSKLKGQPLTMRVTPRSSFRRDAVAAWIDLYLPPACAAALDDQALALAASAMDQAALGLGRPLRLVAGGLVEGGLQ